MVRTENELLKTLFNAINVSTEPKSSTQNNNDVDIEKYRDADGYINLKNVKDINEIKKVFDIVDKKNYLEYLSQKENSAQDLADMLVTELIPFVGDGALNIKIETPNGTGCAKINKTDSNMNASTNIAKYAQVIPNTSQNDAKDTTMEDVVKSDDAATTIDTETANVNDKIDAPNAIMLYDVGGMDNPAFYNAVLHICRAIYFPEEMVLRDDVDDADITSHILLPNIWGKIFMEAVKEFSELIDEGHEVFVIDPETFELTQITNPDDLWNYAMTRVQEEML